MFLYFGSNFVLQLLFRREPVVEVSDVAVKRVSHMHNALVHLRRHFTAAQTLLEVLAVGLIVTLQAKSLGDVGVAARSIRDIVVCSGFLVWCDSSVGGSGPHIEAVGLLTLVVTQPLESPVVENDIAISAGAVALVGNELGIISPLNATHRRY